MRKHVLILRLNVLDVIARCSKVRASLLSELDDIPIACQAYRLRELERVAAQAEGMGNLLLAARIIEQAAREVGHIFE
ncbi:DUF2280 domain-containing protein [Janthinobacterium rivuli]|uniref:DUF2280 domain-containing protein n=1 Tax=Janthinobacterium rivuli TaxID=2751478 RepID=UPI00383A81D7